MKRKCRSYPTLILTAVAIVPMLDDFIHWSHHIRLDAMTSTFVDVHDLNLPAASNMEDLGVLILSICGCFLEVSGIMGCCIWMNRTQATEHRKKRRIDVCRFLFVLLMAALILITVCSRLYLYFDLRYFTISEKLVEASMKKNMKLYQHDDNARKSWDKLQIGFECCGVQNNTDWITYTNRPEVPESCCTVYECDCTSAVHNIGCLRNLTFHINQQVRYGTTDWQTTCLAILVFLFLALVKTLSFSRKEFCGEHHLCKSRKYRLLVEEDYRAIENDNARAAHTETEDSDVRLLINESDELDEVGGHLRVEYSDDEKLSETE